MGDVEKHSKKHDFSTGRQSEARFGLLRVGLYPEGPYIFKFWVNFKFWVKLAAQSPFAGLESLLYIEFGKNTVHPENPSIWNPILN